RTDGGRPKWIAIDDDLVATKETGVLEIEAFGPGARHPAVEVRDQQGLTAIDVVLVAAGAELDTVDHRRQWAARSASAPTVRARAPPSRRLRAGWSSTYLVYRLVDFDPAPKSPAAAPDPCDGSKRLSPSVFGLSVNCWRNILSFWS